MSSWNYPNQTSRNPDNNATFLPAATTLLLLCNCARVIYRACTHADYPMAAFIVFAYSASLSLEHCLEAFAKLPRNEKSRRRDALKLAIWFLYSAITFGFVVQLSPLFPSRAYGAWIYAVAIVFSSAMFYLYVVWDESTQSSGSEKGCGEKRKRFSVCDFPFPVGKMMREKKVHCHEYDSVLEKV
ncbi:hypothetical protein Acr_02g0012740 [Actinidia rufa]|uniref:Uncharacterized protein n=1 Tax=Actinidia rufa TaxID=165716 RepID=A0A7J0E958_9ERIC|nr:hypothetical protein Acr_02g0012740 [Actinidia rufa]